MLTSNFKKFPMSLTIIITIILIIMTLIAKSIYLICFLTTLTLIFVLLTGKSVKHYIKYFKLVIPLLLFIAFIYIMIIGLNLNLFAFIYKVLLVGVLILIPLINTTFDTLNSGIYTIFKFLKLQDDFAEKLSKSISLFICLLKYVGESSTEITHHKRELGIRKGYLKYQLLPVLLLSTLKINNLQTNLKLKFYSVNREEIKGFHKIILICFVVIFLISFLKEVIL